MMFLIFSSLLAKSLGVKNKRHWPKFSESLVCLKRKKWKPFSFTTKTLPLSKDKHSFLWYTHEKDFECLAMENVLAQSLDLN